MNDRKAYLKKWFSDHREDKKAYDRAYYLANRDKKKRQLKEWRLAHPEERSKHDHNRYLSHKSHILSVSKRWKRSNPGKINAMAAKRRAALLKATPPWLSRSQWLEIENIYLEANRISRETRQPYHVDHVVPLQGKTVSGLHVPWNLQILTGHDNLTKSRKLRT